jgi:hypothetical protein
VNARYNLVAATLLAGVAVTFAGDVPNALARAKPGAWSLVRNTDVVAGEAKIDIVYSWVAKLDGKSITVSTQHLKEGAKAASGKAQSKVLDIDKVASAMEHDFKAPGTTITDETLEVAGKKIKCKKLETKTDRGSATKWISDEVPPLGLVKLLVLAADGKEVRRSELLDWGESGGAEKPVD